MTVGGFFLSISNYVYEKYYIFAPINNPNSYEKNIYPPIAICNSSVT